MVETSERVSSPSSSYARKDLEFFKVYLPEFSSRELTKTKKDTEEEEEDRVGDVVFKKGWETFANDHSLEFGDFLVFSYNGAVSRFSVTIFAKDGCKKDLVSVVVTTAERSRVAVEKEPPVLVKPVDDKKKSSVLVEVEPENRRKVNLARDACERAWDPEKKKHKGFEEPVYKPKNPHFVRNITNGSRRQMEIPTSFLKSNGIEMEEEDIELYDENGKKWPMKIVNHVRGRRFSPGLWLCFCQSHKLSTSNKCLFEFVVTSNGTCNQILVRIFRGRLLTVTRNSYQVLAM
ncbi:hypothetical protein N665_0205s0060 [Sinapis alba]|nr:hypothetical protein N665_0205s0060 [Sinapis alba]